MMYCKEEEFQEQIEQCDEEYDYMNEPPLEEEYEEDNDNEPDYCD